MLPTTALAEFVVGEVGTQRPGIREAQRMARLSLTKKQQKTVAGTELLALCQTITDDGQIANDEIVELRNWLHTNRDSDL